MNLLNCLGVVGYGAARLRPSPRVAATGDAKSPPRTKRKCAVRRKSVISGRAGLACPAMRGERTRTADAWRQLRICFGILAACILAIGSGGPAAAQDTAPAAPAQGKEERIGDWTLRCLPPSGNMPERCEMTQVLGDPQSKRDVLLVAVGYAEGETRPVAWVVLPLGVLLPPGVGLKVDEGETKVLPYRACDRRGCATPWLLTESDVSSLKSGKELIVMFRDLEGKSLGLKVSLQGFTKAFDRLK